MRKIVKIEFITGGSIECEYEEKGGVKFFYPDKKTMRPATLTGEYSITSSKDVEVLNEESSIGSSKPSINGYVESVVRKLGFVKSSNDSSFVKGFVKVEIIDNKVFIYHDIPNSVKSEVINPFSDLESAISYMGSRGMGS